MYKKIVVFIGFIALSLSAFGFNPYTENSTMRLLTNESVLLIEEAGIKDLNEMNKLLDCARNLRTEAAPLIKESDQLLFYYKCYTRCLGRRKAEDFQLSVDEMFSIAKTHGTYNTVFKKLPTEFTLGYLLDFLEENFYNPAARLSNRATEKIDKAKCFELTSSIIRETIKYFGLNDETNLVGYNIRYNSMYAAAMSKIKQGSQMSSTTNSLTSAAIRLGATPLDLTQNHLRGEAILEEGLQGKVRAENYLTMARLIVNFWSNNKPRVVFESKSGKSFEGYFIREYNREYVIAESLDCKQVFKIKKTALSDATLAEISKSISK